MPDRTHYDVLGISRDADAGEIRAAWKLHVQVWHPDRFTGEMREQAEQQAARINEAYTTLRDGARRAAYDCRLAAEEQAAEAATAGSSPRRSAARASHPSIHDRGPATPVGTPLAVAAAPTTLGDQVAVALRDVWAIVRQHPRITAAICSVLVLVFGGSIVLQAVSGPVLPSGTVAAQSRAVAGPSSVDAEQVADLDELAAQARAEAAEADAALQQMLREDALAAEQVAREAAAMAAAERRAASKRPKAKSGEGDAPAARAVPEGDAPAVAPPGGRIVRIMPRAK